MYCKDVKLIPCIYLKNELKKFKTKQTNIITDISCLHTGVIIHGLFTYTNVTHRNKRHIIEATAETNRYNKLRITYKVILGNKQHNDTPL